MDQITYTENPIPVQPLQATHITKNIIQHVNWCYIYSVNFMYFLLGNFTGYIISKMNF